MTALHLAGLSVLTEQLFTALIAIAILLPRYSLIMDIRLVSLVSIFILKVDLHVYPNDVSRVLSKQIDFYH